jgi:hypothetical protein
MTLEEQREFNLLKEEVARLRRALGELGGGISNVTTSAKTLLGPFASLFDATVKGTTGMGIYNNALDLTGKELEKLVGQTSIFGVAIGAASDSVKLFVKMAGAQADALMQGYQGFAAAGAAGKADLNDMAETFRKFGATSKEDYPKITQMIVENGETLAKLGGTVAQGVTQFANLSASIQQSGLQTEFLAMGMTVDGINKGLAGYLKTVTQTGQAQKMTQEQLNAGAAEYIRNMDILSKLTGKNADVLQKEQEARMNDEKFALMRREQYKVVQRGGAEGAAMEATIKQQNDLLALVKKYGGDEAEKGAMYTMGQFGEQTPEGRKLLMQMPEAFRMIAEMNRGGTATKEDIMTMMGQETTRFTDIMGSLVQAGGTSGGFNFAQTMGLEQNLAGQMARDAAAVAAGKTPTTSAQAAKEQQDAQTKSTGETVAAMVELIQKQREATTNLTDMSNKGILPATYFMGVLAGKIRDVTEILPGTRPRTAAEINQQSGGGFGRPGYDSNLKFPGLSSSEIERAAQTGPGSVADFVAEVEKSLDKAQAGATRIGEEGVRMIKDMLRQMSPRQRDTDAAMAADAAADAEARNRNRDRAVPGNDSTPVAPADQRRDRTVPGGDSTPVAPADQRRNRAVPGSISSLSTTSDVLAATVNRGYVNIASVDSIGFPQMPTSFRSSLDPDMMSQIITARLTAERETKTESTTTPRDSELIASNVVVSQKLDDLIDIMRRGVGIQDKTLRATYNA